MSLVTTLSCISCHYQVDMIKESFFYLTILVPVAIRAVIMLIFRGKIGKSMSPKEQARESYRSYIYAYLAIATAILLALTVANAKGDINLNDAVFCSAVSFIAFEIALSIQTYKFSVWMDQIVDGLLDCARLGLYLTIIAVFNSARGLTSFTTVIIVMLSTAYISDFCIRTYYNVKTL